MKVKERSEKAGFKLNDQKTIIMASSPITSWQINGKTMETVKDFIVLGSKITADGDCSHEIKRHLFLGREAMTNRDSVLKSRDITLLIKVCLVKAMVFPRSHVWMWELDHKEGWVPKNWCFETVVLERRLWRVPWTTRKSVRVKGNQLWIFIGRTDAEAPVLWPPDAKSRPIEKDPGAGKNRRQEEKGMTKDEMVGWHHQLNGHEFEQALGWREAWCAASMGLQRVGHDWATEQQQQRSQVMGHRSHSQDLNLGSLGFPGGSVVKNPPANAGDMGLSTA